MAVPAVEEILSDLIKIQTVNPPGGEIAAAQYLKHLFDIITFPTRLSNRNRDGLVLSPILAKVKKDSSIYHIPMSCRYQMVGIFHRFPARSRDGFVHGRGAIDCKGLVAVEACAVIHLAQTTKLTGSLIFAATADEEVGGALGAGVLSYQISG